MPQNVNIDTVLNHPMKFFDIYEDISIELPNPVPINVVKLEINKIIRRVNDEIGLHKDLIQANTGSSNTAIDQMSTTAIDQLSTTNIDELGRFLFGWDWNTSENRLRLSDDVYEVLEVYIDDVEWEQVTYEVVKDSNNSSEKYWSQVGRNIWFPLDLADETTTIKLNCKRQYSFVDQVIGEDAIIDVPENYRQLLISGVLYNLTARPKYRDENIFAVNKQTFESEFQSLKFSYHNLESTYESRETTYKY
tara:strand:+ start:543 stop:1289 length:747 start_codon:yes stop_codon:yes gene_type:complete